MGSNTYNILIIIAFLLIFCMISRQYVLRQVEAEEIMLPFLLG